MEGQKCPQTNDKIIKLENILSVKKLQSFGRVKRRMYNLQALGYALCYSVYLLKQHKTVEILWVHSTLWSTTLYSGTTSVKVMTQQTASTLC